LVKSIYEVYLTTGIVTNCPSPAAAQPELMSRGCCSVAYRDSIITARRFIVWKASRQLSDLCCIHNSRQL